MEKIRPKCPVTSTEPWGDLVPDWRGGAPAQNILKKTEEEEGIKGDCSGDSDLARGVDCG